MFKKKLKKLLLQNISQKIIMKKNKKTIKHNKGGNDEFIWSKSRRKK